MKLQAIFNSSAYIWTRRALILALCAIASFHVTSRKINAQAGTVALVNAASYDATVAPGSIGALFGSAMATQTVIASLIL